MGKEQEKWNKINKYLSISEKYSITNPINKVQNFNTTSYPEAAKKYIEQFKIISVKEFDDKVSEIAKKIIEIGEYSCIVSEIGKSNFWLTGRVLFEVKKNGGLPPNRIISLPVKEKGDMNLRKDGEYASILNNSGTILFIDDGSYSGNQLVKLINNVIGKEKIPHSIGLIAATKTAMNLVEKRIGQKVKVITPPILIDSFDKDLLDKAYRELKLPLHHDDERKRGEPTDGNALTALPYKVPDYASVRYTLLVGSTQNPGPIRGYTKGSEPYKSKSFVEEVNANGGLSGLGIESKDDLIKTGLNISGVLLDRINSSYTLDEFLLNLNNAIKQNNAKTLKDITLSKKDIEIFFDEYKNDEETMDCVGEFKDAAMKHFS
ncbi:hypothetical protein [Tenacibaculum sp. nBUS_03]|uniref:hypothetical protein n=1 Tax=Tenacibaculum sp. nBUS_03 TaxID=3395320 RepID=UPI003EBBCB87